MPYNEEVAALGLDEYKYGFKDDVEYLFTSRKGLDGEIVRTGGPEVALWLEKEGYAVWREAEEKAAAV